MVQQPPPDGADEPTMSAPCVMLSWETPWVAEGLHVLSLRMKVESTDVSASRQQWVLAGSWKRTPKRRSAGGDGDDAPPVGNMRMEWNLLYTDE